MNHTVTSEYHDKEHSKHYILHHKEAYTRTILGFWLYIMTDCVLFAALFSTYGVLHHSTFGGPSSQELFSLPLALTETIILLVSTLTSGFAMLSARNNKLVPLIIWLACTLALGLSFVVIEGIEFAEFINQGHSFTTSAFLSSYFTLVGTHGVHVSFGLLWMIVMIVQLILKGMTVDTFRRLVCLNMFWHFLDFIWIFIFTFVYLIGKGDIYA